MVIQTADLDLKTTKLDCISKRAKYRPDTVFDNIGYVIDLDFLRGCYRLLDQKKAVGIDKVTKAAYGAKLEENLTELLARIRRRGYKPQATRLVEIPKEDGSTRPLAISCFEDKIVQLAVTQILEAIYEPTFLPCSYGYRPKKSAHEALQDLMQYSNRFTNGTTIEIDLRKYFNSIPHDKLMAIVEKKIKDRGFLWLIRTLIQTPTMENGKAEINKIGCPQGSIISPCLSNIYLHHVIDSWFEEIKEQHLKGGAEMVRFADDMVFVFGKHETAEKFYEVLPKRLEKFGLKLHVDKSSVIRTGESVARAAAKAGKRIPVYKFLGFTCYWGKCRNNIRWRLKFKSRGDRKRNKLTGLRKYLKSNLATPAKEVITRVVQVLTGWINYHAISDNQRAVKSLIHTGERELFVWINRRGGKRRVSWDRVVQILKSYKYPKYFRVKSMFVAS